MKTHRTVAFAITGALVACLLAAHPRAQHPKAEAPPDRLRFGFEDGTDVIAVETDGPDVRVLLNGDEMPSKRWKHEGSHVQIFDAQGRTIAVVALQGHGGTLSMLPRAPQRPRLGVTLTPVSDALAAQLGIEAAEAMQIASVAEDSPGSKAGLEQYDVIIEIDGEPMHENRLREVLGRKKAGDRVELRVLRRGKPQEIEATLDAEQGPADLFSYDWRTARDLPLLYSYAWADQKFELPKAEWVTTPWQFDYKDRYRTLLQLTQPEKSGGAQDEDAHSELGEHLRSLEERLDKLEKLLSGLDKKLK
jgi:hypothetical protein